MTNGPVSWTTTHGDKVEVWTQPRGWYPADEPQGVWWFWHRKAAGNGKIIADGSEGYMKRAHCLRMAERINPRAQGSRPVNCPNHKPVQHRDARPPWCNKCGLTAAYQDPGPKLGERINPKVET